VSAPALAALFVDEHGRDTPGVVIPRPEVHLSVRFGASTHDAVEVHAMGGLETVRRKQLRSGLRVVMARLQLGAVEGVLGVPASALAGRIVPLHELWGDTTTRRLVDRFAGARGVSQAAEILEAAIAERFATGGVRRAKTELALHAAGRLASASANVNAVAIDLGVSERHLRRVFRETIGVSPKTFAQLTRFRRAVRAARTNQQQSWTTIAASAGYYDQAHLIAEFRAISGVTPRALLGELRTAHSFG